MPGIHEVTASERLFAEKAADPATPAAGVWSLYTKAGGLYLIDDAGTVIGPISGGGVSDHGALTGLSDDDHPQYALQAPTVNTVGATGAAEDISFGTEVHDLTMDQACTFTFSGAPATGSAGSTTVIVRGAFTPTWPASVDWDSGTAPTYATPTVYTFLTVDGGTTVLGFAAGTGMA